MKGIKTMPETLLNPSQVKGLELALKEVTMLKEQVKDLEKKLAASEKKLEAIDKRFQDKRYIEELVSEALRRIQRNS